MKLLHILLLISLGAKGQVKSDSLTAYGPGINGRHYNDPVKRDTVKCWTVTTQPQRDSSLHLILAKAWLIREYTTIAYETAWLSDSTFKSTPIFSPYPTYIKYLHPNKRDSLVVIGDFKPIIQDWK